MSVICFLSLFAPNVRFLINFRLMLERKISYGIKSSEKNNSYFNPTCLIINKLSVINVRL